MSLLPTIETNISKKNMIVYAERIETMLIENVT